MLKKAFTLAEVLITLAIIGVVAALTVPSVIVNTQQNEFKTGLRKAVSVLNSAITMNKALEGESPYDNADLFNYLQQHMSVLKKATWGICYDGSNQTSGDCSAAQNQGRAFNKVFYTTDGMRFEVPSLFNPTRMLTHEHGVDIGTKAVIDGDGNSFYDNDGNPITTVAGICGSYGLGKNPNDLSAKPCIVVVDVNGDRKPNPKGGVESLDTSGAYANVASGYSFPSPADKKLSDIFTIMITEEKAIPFGVVAQKAMYGK